MQRKTALTQCCPDGGGRYDDAYNYRDGNGLDGLVTVRRHVSWFRKPPFRQFDGCSWQMAFDHRLLGRVCSTDLCSADHQSLFRHRTQNQCVVNCGRTLRPFYSSFSLSGFAVLFGVIWIIRSVLASGYLVYPLTASGLPVDWKIPEHLVRDELNGIRGYARLPSNHWSEATGSWGWFPQWLVRMADRPDIIAPLGLISVCLICWRFFDGRSLRQIPSSAKPLSCLLGIGLISLAFWFWNAPDPRFLGAALWIMVLAIVGIALDSITPERRAAMSRIVFFLFCLSVVLCFVRNGLALTISTEGKLAQPIPAPVLTTRITRSGLVVHTPLPGSYCWDCALPCTPYFRSQLKLRGNSLAKGFSIDESIEQAPAHPIVK